MLCLWCSFVYDGVGWKKFLYFMILFLLLYQIMPAGARGDSCFFGFCHPGGVRWYDHRGHAYGVVLFSPGNPPYVPRQRRAPRAGRPCTIVLRQKKYPKKCDSGGRGPLRTPFYVGIVAVRITNTGVGWWFENLLRFFGVFALLLLRLRFPCFWLLSVKCRPHRYLAKKQVKLCCV